MLFSPWMMVLTESLTDMRGIWCSYNKLEKMRFALRSCEQWMVCFSLIYFRIHIVQCWRRSFLSIWQGSSMPFLSFWAYRNLSIRTLPDILVHNTLECWVSSPCQIWAAEAPSTARESDLEGFEGCFYRVFLLR